MKTEPTNQATDDAPFRVQAAISPLGRRAAFVLVVGGASLIAVQIAIPRISAGSAASPLNGLAAALTLGLGLVAAFFCVNLTRRHRTERRMFGAAAAVAILLGATGQALLLANPGITAGSTRTVALILLLLFHPLFAAGAALGIDWPRGRRHQIAVGLDSVLIGTVVMLVLGRVVVGPLGAGPAPEEVCHWILAAQLGALVTCLVACIRVLVADRRLSELGVLALAGAAVASFAATALLIRALATDAALVSAGPAWVIAWALLAVATLTAGPDESTRPLAARVLDYTRRSVVPLAVLTLGAAALDASLRPDRFTPFAIAAMVMAVVLAIRIHVVLGEAERRAEDELRLSHTRALMELNRALAGATELHRTLELVSVWACRLLDARAAGIELLTGDGSMLEIRAAHGLPSHVIGMRFPIEGSFTGWAVQQRRPRTTLDPGTDPYIHPESAAFLDRQAAAAAPLIFGDRALGALFAANRTRAFDSGDLELLASLADQAALAIENAQLFEQVHALSLTDPLTGLANRRQLERDLAREFAAATRGRPLVLVLFDLDMFKEYNDRHGHLAGDEALRLFGRVLNAETRAMNLAARYGGDEFLVLLTDSDREGADIFIRRVSEHFTDEIRKLGRGDLSVSAGLAEFHPDMTSVEDLISAADRVLYGIKADRPSRPST